MNVNIKKTKFAYGERTRD